MNRFVLVACLLFIAALAGCSEDVPRSPPQKWENLDVWIESRPPKIEPGMIEFLVIINRDGRKVASDVLVYLQIGEDGRWVQAIQDGHVGVYRRAMRVVDPNRDILNVQLKRGEQETVMHFPLNFGETK